jgi:TolB-like protein
VTRHPSEEFRDVASKTRTRRATAAVASLVLGALAGCFGSDKDIIDPVVEIPSKRSVVVVPFEDQGQNGFLSERGGTLSLLIADALKAKGEFNVIAKEKVLALYDTEQDPRSLSAAQVAQKTGADYVLMGSIVRWSLREANMVGVIRGDATVEVTLFETADAAADRLGTEKKKKGDEPGTSNLPIAHKRVSAFYPHEYGQPFGSDDMDMTEDKVDAGLRVRTAQEIAWLLVGHTKDEDHLAKGK